jgi:serine/threonine protein kinase
LGILLFYLLTGQYPFSHAKVSDPHYRLLLERKYPTFWERIEARAGNIFSASFKELFMKMISPNAANRASFD